MLTAYEYLINRILFERCFVFTAVYLVRIVIYNIKLINMSDEKGQSSISAFTTRTIEIQMFHPHEHKAFELCFLPTFIFNTSFSLQPSYIVPLLPYRCSAKAHVYKSFEYQWTLNILPGEKAVSSGNVRKTRVVYNTTGKSNGSRPILAFLIWSFTVRNPIRFDMSEFPEHWSAGEYRLRETQALNPSTPPTT